MTPDTFLIIVTAVALALAAVTFLWARHMVGRLPAIPPPDSTDKGGTLVLIQQHQERIQEAATLLEHELEAIRAEKAARVRLLDEEQRVAWGRFNRTKEARR